MNRTASEMLRNLEARVARLEGGRTAAPKPPRKPVSTPAVDRMVNNYTTLMSAENIKSAIIETLMKKGYTAEEIESMVIDTQKHGRALVNIGGDWGGIDILFSDIRGVPVIQTNNLRGDRR